MNEPEDRPSPSNGPRPRWKRILLVAAFVFFLILFLREVGVLAGSGRLF